MDHLVTPAPGMADNARDNRLFQPLRGNAIGALSLVFSASLALYNLIGPHLRLGSDALAFAALLLFAIFALVVRGLPHHRHRVFGAANVVTAVRTAIVCLVAATVFFAADFGSVLSAVWILIALVLAALLLDGVDGYLARQLGRESALGARFDMEVDALLILVLSAAAPLLGKTGGWVLAIGLMRYGFVAAQWFLPALCQPLPASFRRKLVCVVQVAALCLILVPVVTPFAATLLAVLALGLLTYSFGADTAYLLKSGRVVQ